MKYYKSSSGDLLRQEARGGGFERYVDGLIQWRPEPNGYAARLTEIDVIEALALQREIDLAS